MKTARSWLRRRQASVSALAALTAGALVLGTAMPGAVAVAGPKGHGTPRISAPPVVPKGCTGGIAPNPSVEQGSPPTGYTFEPASPVPPGTPSSKQPKLYTTGGYQYDGSKYALISTPDKMVSTAYETVKFVPGGVYTLTDWTGTHADNIQRKDQQFSGLRFYDAGGAQVLENKLPIDHDVAIDDKVARKDFPPSTAPANAASVKFFVSTNYDWAKWDCVYLQLAAYSVKKEVQNPDTGAWGPSATITAGETAHYRVTVTNEGTQPLTGITVKDPWCASQPAPFDLAAGANNAVTCDHPNVTMADDKHVNTATVTGAKYPDGTLGDKTATSTIMVKEAPPIDKVGDFVWIDKNRDGIQDTGEPGVQGVKVTLKDGAGGTVATATTDANGKYLFDKLKDGTYQVCFDVANLPAAVAGYQVTKKDAGGDDTKDSDAGPDGCTATTTLGASKREDLTLDLGLTPPTNKLGDFVWADTDKNGVQDTGEPGVQGVKVTLKDGTGATVGTTTTGADGKYLFDGLNDGTYTVCFDMASLPADYAGYQLTKKDAGGDDTKDSDADPATTCTPPTTLGADKREDLTLDAGIVSPPNKVGDFVWVDKNKNGVQDPGEPGVQGVTVTLKTGDGTLVTTTTTDANGKYLFDGLNDGTYIVCFDIAHLPPAMAGYLVTKQNVGDDAKDSDADLSTGCTPPTTVGKDKREDLTLDLGLIPPANRLGDFVWADTNKNGVQDTGEPGVPGVTVTLKNGTTTVATTTTGADGKYLFDNLDDGTYTVCFDMAKLPADYTGYALTKKDAGGDDAKDSDAGTDGCTPPTTLGDTKHEDLTLDAGIVSPPNRLGDYVWVDKNKNGLQDDGEPAVPGVKATLQDGTGKPVGTATTDANGKYLFDNLDDGTYTVCFDIKNLPAAVAGYQVTKQNAGDVTKDSDADASTGCTKPTTLGKDKREDLTLDMGLVAPVNRLGDYVWADTNKNGLQDTGEPGVQGVKVTLQDGTGKPVGTATTDANGKYLFDNLDDGTYTVCFDVKALPDKYADNVLTKTGAAGFNGTDSAADQTSACTKPTTLGAAKREDLTLDAGIISPPNKVGDFVWADKNKNGIQDKDEIGVPGVKVTLKDDTGKTVGTVTTGTDGRYLFDNLPDGSYQVCFDMKALPGDFAEYQLTKVNAAGHNGTDSAADLSTGCTPVTKLGPGHREDLTLDAGLIAPVNRVGDYVWADKNANGIQDPGEPGVPGVKVTLKDDTGKTIATQSTADGGKYLFSDLPDGSYQVCFETSSAAGDLAGAALTKANAAGHNGTDSAADPASKCTPVTKLGAGHREDLTLDAGLVVPAVTPKNKLGDYVWYDANDNGIQDKGEEGVDGVKVTLKDGSGKVLSTTTTASGGKYLFGNLPDGSYQVCFDTSYASAEYRSYAFTKAGAAGRNGTDSAADPASKCTPVTKLGPGKREDLTLDAGLAGGHAPAAVSPKLASTGSPIDWFAGLGTLLLLGGFGLITLVRRRSRSTE